MTNDPSSSDVAVEQAAHDLPGDALLSEIYLFQDVEGRWPVRIVQRNFRCSGQKEHGYMLVGDRALFSPAAMAALMRGVPGAEGAYTLKSVKFSPLSLLSVDVGGNLERLKGKIPPSLRDICPSGIEVFHHVCVAENEGLVLANALRRYADRWSQERTTVSRVLANIRDAALRLGLNVPMADQGREYAARLVLQREAALLPCGSAAAAAREALAVISDAHEDRDDSSSVLGGIDAVIAQLMAVRSAIEWRAAGPVVKASDRDFDFVSDSGITYRARIVLSGDSFGFCKNGRLVASNEGPALIELFDARSVDTPHGVFTGARYEVGDYERALDAGAMVLSDQNPEWVLGKPELSKILEWARAALLDLDAPARLEYGPMESWDSMGKAVRGDVVFDLYRQESEGHVLFAARKEGMPIWPGAGGYSSLDELLKIKRLTVDVGRSVPLSDASPEFGL